jgi:hypothetical protein
VREGKNRKVSDVDDDDDDEEEAVDGCNRNQAKYIYMMV